MRVTIKFFIPLNQQIGMNQMEIELPDGTTGRELVRQLAERFSHIRPIRERFRAGRVFLLIGKEFIHIDTPLQDQQVVVILPYGSCCHP